MYRIMLVDDEPSVIDSIRRMTAKNDAFVVACEAYMVSEAKPLLAEYDPHVVFTDIKMPGGSGLELLKYISQNMPRCVMVVVSGYDDFQYVRDAFVYGVEDYLLKPVSPAVFHPFLDRLASKLANNSAILENAVLERDPELGHESPQTMQSSEKLVKDIESYIDAHIGNSNSIYDICKAFSISQPYLSKIFRRHLDCSYNEFLVSVRIAKAKRLLLQRQDLLIGTIASLTGFSDQFYFSRVFKNAVGVTPSEYRGRM